MLLPGGEVKVQIVQQKEVKNQNPGTPLAKDRGPEQKSHQETTIRRQNMSQRPNDNEDDQPAEGKDAVSAR